MNARNNLINNEVFAETSSFPYLVVDDFLPDDLVAKIDENWEVLDNYYHHFANGGNRKSVQFGTNKFTNLVNSNAFFCAVYKRIINIEFLSEIYQKFQPFFDKFGLKDEFRDFSNISFKDSKTDYLVTDSLFKKALIKFFINPIVRKFGIRGVLRGLIFRWTQPGCHALLSFSKSQQGYREAPHVDARHKIFVGLIYLDDMDHEGGLNIYKNKSNDSDIKESPMFPREDQIELEKRVQPKRNRLVLFLNSNNAWHGTEPFKDKSRRFIYFSFGARWVESAFETKRKVTAGDVHAN